jgi:tungstate transport system substrate-binding protein
MLRRHFICLAALAAFALAMPAAAQDKSIVVASTTSTEQSGLFKHILPLFEQKTGIKVRVVARHRPGARHGQARRRRRRVRARPRSRGAFVAEGFGVERREVMYNDFVVVGPAADPAGEGLQGHGRCAEEDRRGQGAVRLARRQERHARGRAALLEDRRHRRGRRQGQWYRETGSGMGPTLNTAARHERLCPHRSRHLAFIQEPTAPRHRSSRATAKLFNQYGVMLVNPARHKHVKKDLGQAFIEWITSSEGQRAIASYKVNGEQLFFPNYKKVAH